MNHRFIRLVRSVLGRTSPQHHTNFTIEPGAAIYVGCDGHPRLWNSTAADLSGGDQ